MKKLSVVTAVIATVYMSTGYAVPGAFSVEAKSEKATQNAKNSIGAIMAEIQAAVGLGDEQLVASLLQSAIKNNPQMASEIVSRFVASAPANPSAPNAVNVAEVMNDVIAGLGNTPGSEAMVAAVLSSYTPAAGGVNSNQNQALPPALPSVGSGSGSRGLPVENPNQISVN